MCPQKLAEWKSESTLNLSFLPYSGFINDNGDLVIILGMIGDIRV